MGNNNLYEKDYHLWLDQTIAHLKHRQFEQLDIANLIEEIEGLNRRDRRQLYNRLVRLYEHQLKLDYWHEEKERNERGWRLTIVEQSRQIRLLLEDSPSLKNYLAEIRDRAYQDALENVLIMTGLSARFPEKNPYLSGDRQPNNLW